MKTILTNLASVSLVSFTISNAATIVDLDFTGVSGTVAHDKATFELTATDAADANLVILEGLNFKSPSTVYANTAGTTTATNDLNLSGWGAGGTVAAAFSGNRYISFTLQASAGNQLNLNGASITYAGFRNGSGAPSEFGIFAKTAGGTFVSADQIGSDVTVANTGPGNVTNIAASFSGAQWDGITDQVEIRLYAAGSSTTGNMHFSDFVIDNGTITPVPEPTSSILLGLGGMALILRRRK